MRKLTKTEELYHRWLNGDEATQELVVKDLTNICSAACRNLSPRWIPSVHKISFDNRWKMRWPWCNAFVRKELRDGPVDDCRYIGRRCKQRLIDDIRRETSGRSQGEYLAEVERDEKGRFLKSHDVERYNDPEKIEEEEYVRQRHGPVRVLFSRSETRVNAHLRIVIGGGRTLSDSPRPETLYTKTKP